MSDWVLLAATPEALNGTALTVAEVIEPVPGFSVWSDHFNNLLDVLKTNPVEEFKRLLDG
jgi:hypothetical protein